DPSAITRPWSITEIRSASWSASSRYWVVSSTVVPPATSALTASQTSLRPRGSSPVGGSARHSPGGGPPQDQPRRAQDQAGRQVEPAPHPTRVLLDRLAAHLAEPEPLQQLVGAAGGRERRPAGWGWRA